MIVSKIGTSYPFEVDGVKTIGFHHQNQQTSANFDPVQKRPIPKRQGILKRSTFVKRYASWGIVRYLAWGCCTIFCFYIQFFSLAFAPIFCLHSWESTREPWSSHFGQILSFYLNTRGKGRISFATGWGGNYFWDHVMLVAYLQPSLPFHPTQKQLLLPSTKEKMQPSNLRGLWDCNDSKSSDSFSSFTSFQSRLVSSSPSWSNKHPKQLFLQILPKTKIGHLLFGKADLNGEPSAIWVRTKRRSKFCKLEVQNMHWKFTQSSLGITPLFGAKK